MPSSCSVRLDSLPIPIHLLLLSYNTVGFLALLGVFLWAMERFVLLPRRQNRWRSGQHVTRQRSDIYPWVTSWNDRHIRRPYPRIPSSFNITRFDTLPAPPPAYVNAPAYCETLTAESSSHTSVSSMSLPPSLICGLL